MSASITDGLPLRWLRQVSAALCRPAATATRALSTNATLDVGSAEASVREAEVSADDDGEQIGDEVPTKQVRLKPGTAR
jgi:hypothetical protein